MAGDICVTPESPEGWLSLLSLLSHPTDNPGSNPGSATHKPCGETSPLASLGLCLFMEEIRSCLAMEVCACTLSNWEAEVGPEEERESKPGYKVKP